MPFPTALSRIKREILDRETVISVYNWSSRLTLVSRFGRDPLCMIAESAL